MQEIESAVNSNFSTSAGHTTHPRDAATASSAERPRRQHHTRHHCSHRKRTPTALFMHHEPEEEPLRSILQSGHEGPFCLMRNAVGSSRSRDGTTQTLRIL